MKDAKEFCPFCAGCSFVGFLATVSTIADNKPVSKLFAMITLISFFLYCFTAVLDLPNEKYVRTSASSHRKVNDHRYQTVKPNIIIAKILGVSEDDESDEK